MVLVQKKLFQLLVFLAPTQLALHLWPNWAFLFGIRVDYLAPAIYFTDLLIIAFLINSLGLLRQSLRGKGLKYFLIITFFALINIFNSTVLQVALIKWLKILEFSLLSVVLARNKGIKIKEWFLKPFSLSLLFFSGIGIMQFLKGRTLGGLLYYLGERSFSLSTPGTALFSIVGAEKLRAYSTFSHPNSFAGYLAVGIIFLLLIRDKKRRVLEFFALLASLLAFVLAFSRSASFALALVFIFYTIRKKVDLKDITKKILFTSVVVSVALPLLFSKVPRPLGLEENIQERVTLTLSAGEIVSKNPLLGIGLNNFIKASSELLFQKGTWNLQPVHNIFLLVFSETGLVGLLLLTYVLWIALEKKTDPAFKLSLLLVIITGFFDHYWLTLQQNMFLFSLLLGFSLRKPSHS